MSEQMISVFGSNVGEEEIRAVANCIGKQWMGIGSCVRDFEAKFAERLGLNGFAMADSGSNSLYLALKVLNLPQGSEVIVPSFTWISCAHAVVLAGCKPVFCDVELETCNTSAATVEIAITTNTAAVMVVHYAGKPVGMDAIVGLGYPVVEDAAHAVDSRLGGVACGAIGDVGIYSFDAVKNLACPEGGGVTSKNEEIIERVKLLRYCGIGKSGFDSSTSNGKQRWWEYNIADFCPKCLPNDVCASIASVQLQKLDRNQAKRKEIWATYQNEFRNLGWLVLPCEPAADERHSYFTYCVRLPGGERDCFARFLLDRHIYTTLRYHPLHLNPIYGSTARLPNCELLNDQALSLPIHPHLSNADVDRVVAGVREFGSKFGL